MQLMPVFSLKRSVLIERLDMTDAKKTLDRCGGPADEALIPARLVLGDKAFDRIVDLLEHPPAPTRELRELMSGTGGRPSPGRSGA